MRRQGSQLLSASHGNSVESGQRRNIHFRQLKHMNFLFFFLAKCLGGFFCLFFKCLRGISTREAENMFYYAAVKDKSAG